MHTVMWLHILVVPFSLFSHLFCSNKGGSLLLQMLLKGTNVSVPFYTKHYSRRYSTTNDLAHYK